MSTEIPVAKNTPLPLCYLTEDEAMMKETGTVGTKLDNFVGRHKKNYQGENYFGSRETGSRTVSPAREANGRGIAYVS